MLDTLATSRALTEAGFDARQAEAITAAVRQAVEQGNHVTPEHLDLALEKLRREMVTPEQLDLAIEKLRRELVTPEHLDLALDKLRAEFRAEMGEMRAEFRAEMGEMRAEFRGEMGEMRGEMGEMRGEMGEMRGEFRAALAETEVRMVRWIVGTALATAGLIVAALRLMGQ